MSPKLDREHQEEILKRIGLTAWSLTDVFRFVIALVLIVGFLYIAHESLRQQYADI